MAANWHPAWWWTPRGWHEEGVRYYDPDTYKRTRVHYVDADETETLCGRFVGGADVYTAVNVTCKTCLRKWRSTGGQS